MRALCCLRDNLPKLFVLYGCVTDVFLPTPDNLMVNLADCRELIRDLLEKLPSKYKESYDTHSALGAALQVAYKLLVSVLVFTDNSVLRC